MSLRNRIAVLMTIVVSSLVLVSAALASHPWSITTAYGTYVGDCNENQFIQTGKLVCNGRLVPGSGPGVTGGAVVINDGNSKLTLTPSGQAKLNS